MSADRTALVIGAGLAGSACAATLARRGWSVTLLSDAGDAGASRVPAAVMAPGVGSATDPLTRLRRRGVSITRAWLRRLASAGHDGGRITDGVLLLPSNDRDHLRLERVGPGDRPERRLTADEAHAATGIPARGPAVLHPLGGCFLPERLAVSLQAIAGSPTKSIPARVDRLVRRGGTWTAFGTDGLPLAHARIVVLAAGTGCLRLRPETRRWLLPARGQATAFAATPGSVGLRLPISGGGYVTPAIGDIHWAGATLQRGDDDPNPRDADDHANLAFARDRLGLDEKPAAIDRFVGFRATTPNRLPLVGQIDDDLWITAGHGAHGLMTTPISAGLLADAIGGRRHPLMRLLDPGTRRDGHATTDG